MRTLTAQALLLSSGTAHAPKLRDHCLGTINYEAHIYVKRSQILKGKQGSA